MCTENNRNNVQSSQCVQAGKRQLFSVEAASKPNVIVIARNGDQVSSWELTKSSSTLSESQPLKVIHKDGTRRAHDSKGRYYGDECNPNNHASESDHDLFVLSKSQSVFVNLYTNADNTQIIANDHPTLADADRHAEKSSHRYRGTFELKYTV